MKECKVGDTDACTNGHMHGGTNGHIHGRTNFRLNVRMGKRMDKLTDGPPKRGIPDIKGVGGKCGISYFSFVVSWLKWIRSFKSKGASWVDTRIFKIRCFRAEMKI
jgi:hypothetical protein